MTKENLIESITSRVKVEGLNVVRVYGVPMGVGYDLILFLDNGEAIDLHAGPRSWDMPGHLARTPYGVNTYRGTDSYPGRYIERIQKYFKEGEGFKNYLRRFKKEDLIRWNERA